MKAQPIGNTWFLFIALVLGLISIPSNSNAAWTNNMGNLDQKPSIKECIGMMKGKSHPNLAWDRKKGSKAYGKILPEIKSIRELKKLIEKSYCNEYTIDPSADLGSSDDGITPGKLFELACYTRKDKRHAKELMEEYEASSYPDQNYMKFTNRRHCSDFWISNMPLAVELRKKEKLAAQGLRKNEERKKSMIKEALAVPDKDKSYMVWKDGNISNNNAVNLSHEVISTVNMDSWDETYRILAKMKKDDEEEEKPYYSEPDTQKGEFEKSKAYEIRKAKEIEIAKKEYNQWTTNFEKYMSKRRIAYEKAVQNKEKIMTKVAIKALSKLFGNPVYEVKYDADKESFIISIHSSNLGKYSAVGMLRSPINNASTLKPVLQNATPYVVYKMIRGNIIIQRIVLGSEDKAYLITDASDNIGEYVFSEDAANTYRPKYKIALKQSEEEKKHKKAEEDKLNKERLAEEEELSKKRLIEYQKARVKQRASWPNGAVAKVSSGAFLCSSFKTAYKAMAIRRANNPYVSMPDDCMTLPRTGYAVSVQHSSGGITKIRLVGSTRGGYTGSNFVEE